MSIKSKSNVTTTGKIRDALADSLYRISRGELAANDGKIIVGLANQITSSMSMEIKLQSLCAALGQKVTELGAINIGVPE